ncbi:MAG: hypothetical protein LBE91_01415 [Tannerella sp.]|jgi:hypothetical protein|nr:hypothetical protein [Tannerella sp.]
MSKLSLCILDDKIPVAQLTDIEVDDTSYIDGNVLRHCLTLKNEDESISDWGDINLRNFINTIKDNNDYIISGFTNHSNFFNYIEDVLFSPDIVVFDWDIGINEQDPSDNLLRLLSSTYCLVAIFTGEDTEEGVSQEISKPEFKDYDHRCFLIKKQDDNSVDTLKAKIKEREKDFSFEFGNKFRKASLSALNEILVELGKVTSDELNHYFNIEDENDLRGFVAEKYNALFGLGKNKLLLSKGHKWVDSLMHVVRKKFERQLSSLNVASLFKGNKPDINYNILEKLWSYRLYHKYPDSDKSVRKGDIVCKDEQFYLIINSDCHLPYVWGKNLGFVNVIPLEIVDSTNKNLEEILSLTPNGNKRDYKQSSFSEKMQSFPDGAFCMPFVPINEIFKTFLFFAKNLTYIQVTKPALNQNETFKKKIFTYDHFDGYMRICTLSEPFLTPIVSNILLAIAGHGCPDYSNATKTLLDNNIKKIFV